MKIFKFGKFAVSLGLVLATLLPWKGTGFAAGLTYNGSYQAEENAGGEFIQRRQQSAGLSLSHELTNIISLREYVRYNERWEESTDNKSEQMTQGVSLIANHDLWQSDFSAASTLDLGSEHEQLESESYGARWKSKWKTDMVPGLAVRLDSRKESRGVRDSEDLGMSTALDWRRNNLSLTYDYRWRQQEPDWAELLDTTTSQDFQAGYTYSFWQRRLSLGLKHNYRTTSNEREARQTGSFSLPVNLIEVRTGTDATPADAFEDPSVAINNQMDDSVLNVSAYSVTTNSTFNNIMIRPDGVNIDQIHIYTEIDLGGTALDGLTWSVYTNDLLGTSWDSVPLNGISYNSILRRYELDIGELAVDYLKIVLDISLLGTDINFTEIEARDNIFLSSDTVILNETDTSQTGLSLGARVTENLLLSYRADFETRETSSVARESDQNELSQSAGARYLSPDQTFSSSLTFGNRRRETETGAGVTENETRSYALDLDKQFLPTLSAAIGISKSENYQDSTQFSEAMTYRLDSFAKLYPDLDLNIQLNYGETTNFQTATKSDNNRATVGLLSRLSPAITLSLREDYSESGSSESYKTVASLNWQISDMLVVRGRADHNRTERDDAGSTEAVGFNSNLNLALTTDLLLEVDYSSSRASGDVTETGEASLNWYPKSWLRLEAGCSYRHAPALPADDYRGYARADINFKLP